LAVLIPLQDLLNFRIAYSPPLGDIKGLSGSTEAATRALLSREAGFGAVGARGSVGALLSREVGSGAV
jgi:hypothetical protein